MTDRAWLSEAAVALCAGGQEAQPVCRRKGDALCAVKPCQPEHTTKVSVILAAQSQPGLLSDEEKGCHAGKHCCSSRQNTVFVT